MSDFFNNDNHNKSLVHNEGSRRLELRKKDGSATLIPYMHIGLLEYNGKDMIVFTASSFIVTIKGANLHHIVRNIRTEKLDIIKEGFKPQEIDSDDAQIDSIIITDTRQLSTNPLPKTELKQKKPLEAPQSTKSNIFDVPKRP